MKHIIIMSVLLAAGCAHKTPNPQAKANMMSSKNAELRGEVVFTSTVDGVRVQAAIAGLKPNVAHGFHIHEKGLCDGPKYKSAGEHYNPTRQNHCAPGKHSHAGDLGNLMADAKGEAHLDLVLTEMNIEDFRKLAGRSVLIHAKKDDLKSQPAGKSGNRIGCGIIKDI